MDQPRARSNTIPVLVYCPLRDSIGKLVDCVQPMELEYNTRSWNRDNVRACAMNAVLREESSEHHPEDHTVTSSFSCRILTVPKSTEQYLSESASAHPSSSAPFLVVWSPGARQGRLLLFPQGAPDNFVPLASRGPNDADGLKLELDVTDRLDMTEAVQFQKWLLCHLQSTAASPPASPVASPPRDKRNGLNAALPARWWRRVTSFPGFKRALAGVNFVLLVNRWLLRLVPRGIYNTYSKYLGDSMYRHVLGIKVARAAAVLGAADLTLAATSPKTTTIATTSPEGWRHDLQVALYPMRLALTLAWRILTSWLRIITRIPVEKVKEVSKRHPGLRKVFTQQRLALFVLGTASLMILRYRRGKRQKPTTIGAAADQVKSTPANLEAEVQGKMG